MRKQTRAEMTGAKTQRFRRNAAKADAPPPPGLSEWIKAAEIAGAEIAGTDAIIKPVSRKKSP